MKRSWRLNADGKELLDKILKQHGLNPYDVSAVQRKVEKVHSIEYKTVQKILSCQCYSNRSKLEDFFEALDCKDFVLENHCEFKQGRETTEVNHLAEILQELTEQERSRLDIHYAACCLEGFQGSPVESVVDLLANLTEMLPPKGKPKPLVQFVAWVVQDSAIGSERRQQLQEWGESQRGFAELQTVAPLPVAGEQYLMIAVKTVSTEAGSYQVQAVLVDDPQPLDLDGIPNYEQIPVSKQSYTADEFSALLLEVLTYCHDQHKVVLENLNVQWFLPSELLYLNIEQWKFGKRERWFSAEYKIVIRSTDRQFDPEYKLKGNASKQRWTNLIANKQSICLNLLASGFEDIQQMCLDMTQPQFVGCRFKLPPTPQEQADLFDEILFAALPVAVWVQSTFAGQDAEMTNHAVWNRTVGDLPGSLTHMRREARVRKQPCLSLHLALLWDNPYRPFPHIDYAS
jgi:hypothetical protein